MALVLDMLFDLDVALTIPPASDAVLPSPGRIVAGMGAVAALAAECAVCLEQCQDGKETPCGHAFHEDCIYSWLRQQNSCPLCRRRIFSGDVAEASRRTPAS